MVLTNARCRQPNSGGHMSTILAQLAAIFDAQGWTYELDPDQGHLSTAFSTSQGPLSLVLRPLEEQAVLIEVLTLATLDAAHAAALTTMARHVPEISLAHDPANGQEAPPAAPAAKARMQALAERLMAADSREAVAALAEERDPPVPEVLRSALQELADLQNKNDRISLERRRTLCQTLLGEAHRDDAPELWAALQEELGNTCARLCDMTGMPSSR
jgi:hypothetical protein